MTVRWGFLGAGSIARSSVGPAVHAAAGNTLYAVAARDRERAAALGPTRSYAEYPQLLKDPEVDAVYVCLHNLAHLEWVRAALRHGKHVLCEKPLGITADEVAEMSAEAAAARRLLVEAAWNRWHPRTRHAESLLAEGAIGSVRHVTARFEGARPAPGNYRRDVAMGGGALWDVGCYAVAGALSALNWRLPTGASATATHWADGGADAETMARLTFDAGVTVDITASLDGRDEQVLEVRGDGGTLRLLHPAFTAGARPSTLQLVVDGLEQTIDYPAIDPYQVMVEAFGAAVRGKRAWLVPLAQSAAVATTIDAIQTVRVPVRARSATGTPRAAAPAAAVSRNQDGGDHGGAL